MAIKKRMKLPDASKVSYQPRPIDPGPGIPGPIVDRIWPKFPRPGDPMPPWVNIRDLLDKKQIIALTKLDIDFQVANKRLETQAIKNELSYLEKIKKTIGGFK